MPIPRLTGFLFGLLAGSCFAKEFEITISAGNVAHPVAIVSKAVSADFPTQGLLRSANAEIPFQRSDSGNIVFVAHDLRAGESRAFSVVAANPPSTARADNQNGRVSLLSDGKLILTYQGPETAFPRPDIKPIFKRGGYIHPVLSPGGKMVTDDFPPNHIHHHGLWLPWTKTVFEGREPDFWNMGEGKGKVEFVELGDVWSGPVQCGFSAQHRFIDLTSGEPKNALNETWKVTAYSLPNAAGYFIFDLVSTQTCATASALTLPKYYYGGLGFRGNWAWNGESKCSFLTDSGETDRVKGNETRGNWCHLGGEVEGEFAGIAILCHPDNFRAPQPMRLHPKEPFFCFAPSQLGDWAIEPGKPYVSKYRFIVKDGRPDKSELDSLWRAYAHPPNVTIINK